jgi:hypothetical protein
MTQVVPLITVIVGAGLETSCTNPLTGPSEINLRISARLTRPLAPGLQSLLHRPFPMPSVFIPKIRVQIFSPAQTSRVHH